ncbi:MAG: VC1465 family Xer recombination activation factor [Sideroxyarcus sp.]|nr:VC1465 family Xer recombination activation factor [Sideroxyarcus sp.]
MSRPLPRARKWIVPQDFSDLRIRSGLSRRQAAEALDVTVRTVQNWETGGARIPWMAFRLLRQLRGFALPGLAWEGWTLCGAVLYSPAGRGFDAANLEHIEQVFAMSRLWRQEYTARNRKPAAEVLTFPERTRDLADSQQAPQGHLKLIGGAS